MQVWCSHLLFTPPPPPHRSRRGFVLLLPSPLLLHGTVDVSTGDDSPASQRGFVYEYLVNRCGPPEKASNVTRGLRRIKPSERPDSMMDFLKVEAFDASVIKRTMLSNPRLIGLDVPKFQASIDLGFAGAELRRFVLSNPKVFNYNAERNVVPMIELWRRLLGSEDHLHKHLCRTTWFLGIGVSSLLYGPMPSTSDVWPGEEIKIFDSVL